VPITVASLWRFPVKGLRGEAVPGVDLVAGQGVPHDRRFAVVRGDASFDPARPSWLPPKRFVMLKKDTALARLAGRVDFTAGTIALVDGDEASCVAPFATADGRARLDGFVNQVLGPRPEGPARLVEAGELSFTDVPENGLSIINLESVRELETRMGRPLHPLRFRGNVYVAGGAAWDEWPQGHGSVRDGRPGWPAGDRRRRQRSRGRTKRFPPERPAAVHALHRPECGRGGPEERVPVSRPAPRIPGADQAVWHFASLSRLTDVGGQG
jgi:hypothetical protein